MAVLLKDVLQAGVCRSSFSPQTVSKLPRKTFSLCSGRGFDWYRCRVSPTHGTR